MESPPRVGGSVAGRTRHRTHRAGETDSDVEPPSAIHGARGTMETETRPLGNRLAMEADGDLHHRSRADRERLTSISSKETRALASDDRT